MFTGRHYHNLETKGRLAIPANFRAELKSGIITGGLDGCLFLFPNSYWQKLSKKLASLPLTQPAARQLVRLLTQSAVPIELDSQGRTLIPKYLLDQAHLKKQVVIAGALTRVELWDKDLYHQHLDLIAQEISKPDAAINSLGI
jgi:MraZ protein